MKGAATVKTSRGVATVFLVLAAVLVVSWAIAIAVSWNHIVSSHTRLGYLIADVGLVMPLCLMSGWGLLGGLSCTRTILPFTLGALAYDAVHFAVYLAQERFLGLGPPVYVSLLAAVLVAIGWLVVWGHHHAAGAGAPVAVGAPVVV
jgi:hypothetical protein